MIPIAKPSINQEEIDNVIKVLNSGMLASGKWVIEFEKKFADYLCVKEVITTVNGTAALDLALKSINIKEGDEVIVPDFTFISTANAVLFQKAKPIFADVDLDYYTLDLDDVVNKITSKTKAIICVHLFGQPCDMDKLLKICNDYNLHLIEDCAQAHGATYKNKKVGSFGIGCFSFYPTKNITTGEGGAVSTQNFEIAKKLRLLINHGQTRKYYHETLGYNLRMSNIQAALGVAQLSKLDMLNKKRISNAEYFNKKISNDKLITPRKNTNVTHVYHQYVLRVPKNRGKFLEYLKENDVGTAIHYPLPIHMQPLYRKLGYKHAKCVNSKILSEQVVSIPVHPGLKKEDLDFIVSKLNEW
ncbi:MAG: DegT/DnrJ/EryC1/StrS family aminotransferase [Candidatus Odinarchaeia archaeon]